MQESSVSGHRASWISQVLRHTGIVVFQRIMGPIVAAIAVEFIMDGVAMHFPNLFNFGGHGE